ncbi:extracellular solute-binding protein [Candidatus Uhrbacteria bacterium]|nr:extracellular solute-binding protein [Candidatus Uhrbacteria bacterium]
MLHGIRRVGIAALAAVLLFSGAMCSSGGIPKNVAARLKPVQLVWWGVQETEEEMQPIIAEYQKLHTNVSVTYRRLRLSEYERLLLGSLAEGDFQGPDVFSLPSGWERRFQSKLLPAPPTITMPVKEVRGSIKKETFASLQTIRTPAPQELANTFVDVVVNDAVLWTEPAEGAPSRQAVYGLPLSMDTMVLYANRDLLNAAGIPEPAKTWSELQAHVPRLTKRSPEGAIAQAGAAIGTGRNVQRSFDILSLLMMQNGAVMAGPNGEPRFMQTPESLSNRTSPPGADAILFYTDFASTQRASYTWDAAQPDSLEAFLQGRVAYFFGYHYHLATIKSRAPRINLSVTGVPHVAAATDPGTGMVVGSDVIEGTQPVAINAASYWLNSVSERTKYPNEAWDLVLFATMRPTVVQKYLTAAARPTALRGLVAQQLQDPTLRVFANQLLTARTWYRGKDPEVAEAAFHDLMDDVLQGVDVGKALELAAQKIAQTL